MSAPTELLADTSPPPTTGSAGIVFTFVEIVLDVLAVGIVALLIARRVTRRA